MGAVAVPGGTGGIGRALVEAIVALGKDEVKIFSRKENEKVAKELGVPIVVVDFSSVDSLKQAMEENGIETIVSALSSMPEEGIPPEVNLVRAAHESKTTRRFVASNWGFPLTSELAKRLPSTPTKLQTLAELEKTELEYTTFYVGFLTDFFTGPTYKTYMNPMVAVLDIAHDTAAIPGKGDTPVTFTHTFDMAKYVSLTLGLEKWDREYYIVGDKATWNEVVRAAEEAKGIKFNIVHDSVEDMKKGVVTELPVLTKALPYMSIPREAVLAFAAVFGLIFEAGETDFKVEGSLNEKFPDIMTLKITDAVRAAAKAS